MKAILIWLLAVYLPLQLLADKIVLLDQPKDSLQARADFIQTAQESIRAQYFSIDNDFISKTGLALLAEATRKNPNLKVRILVDAMHNSMKKETMAAIMGSLGGKSNIEIREYNPFNLFHIFRYTKRMHDKGLIIDSKYMISGGRNIANGYYGRSGSDKGKHALPVFEDSDALLLESDAIATAANYFDNLWNSKFVRKVYLYEYSAEQLDPQYCSAPNSRYNDDIQRCEQMQRWITKKIVKEQNELNKLIAAYQNNQMRITPVASDWGAKAIAVNNVEFLYDEVVGQKSNLKKMASNTGSRLYKAIETAQSSVIVITPYLVVTPEHQDLFRKLIANNVEVTVVTNSKGSNDVPSVNVGYEETRQSILNMGVKIFEYQGPDTLHAKMVLIDKAALFIGSYNWDFRSQNLNREVGILAKIDMNLDNVLSFNIIRKFAKILNKSCLVGGGRCEPIVRSESVEDLSESELADLVAAFNARKEASEWLYRLTYPIIKKQL